MKAPLATSKLFFNDLYYLNPEGTRRWQIAKARYDALFKAHEADPESTMAVSVGADQRGRAARTGDFLSWLAWLPAKAATAPLIDGLGGSAWQNMVRRTRVMIDRESNFVAEIPERTAGTRERSVTKLQKGVVWAGRQGAVRLFFEQAGVQLPTAGDAKGGNPDPKITLIGHSMGAIIAGDILAREPDFHFDNVVFMAAACSINDFKIKVLPYLENQMRLARARQT